MNTTGKTIEPKANGLWASVLSWFDSWAATDVDENSPDAETIDWARVIPFLGIHLGCLAVFWVGWSWTAVGIAIALYFARMFAITAFYHRYFSHRAFKTSRPVQFLGAVLGACAVQRGPLWWAAHHRLHHKHSDEPEDAHSPRQRGFFFSHTGWILIKRNFRTRTEQVRDFLRFRELRILDRFDILVPFLLALSLLALGAALERWAPGLGTNAWQVFVWGFLISTVVLYHFTFTINSLAHRFGKRRFETKDDSRNNLWLALATLGEGWHNNHHHYPGSARQGFYWWELDVSWYVLRLLAAFGIVWDLRPVPEATLERRRAR